MSGERNVWSRPSTLTARAIRAVMCGMAAVWHESYTIGASDVDLLAVTKGGNKLGPATAVVALAAGTVVVGYNGAPTVPKSIVFSSAAEGRGVLIDKLYGTGSGSSAIAIEVYWDVSGS